MNIFFARRPLMTAGAFLWIGELQVRPTAQMNQQGAGFPVAAPFRSAVPPRGQPPVVRSMPSARPITGQQPMGPQALAGRPLGMPSGGPVMPQPRPSGAFKFTPAMRNPPNQVPASCFSLPSPLSSYSITAASISPQLHYLPFFCSRPMHSLVRIAQRSVFSVVVPHLVIRPFLSFMRIFPFPKVAESFYTFWKPLSTFLLAISALNKPEIDMIKYHFPVFSSHTSPMHRTTQADPFPSNSYNSFIC